MTSVTLTFESPSSMPSDVVVQALSTGDTYVNVGVAHLSSDGATVTVSANMAVTSAVRVQVGSAIQARVPRFEPVRGTGVLACYARVLVHRVLVSVCVAESALARTHSVHARYKHTLCPCIQVLGKGVTSCCRAGNPQMSGCLKPLLADTQWSYKLLSASVNTVDRGAMSVDTMAVLRDLNLWLLSVASQHPNEAPLASACLPCHACILAPLLACSLAPAMFLGSNCRLFPVVQVLETLARLGLVSGSLEVMLSYVVASLGASSGASSADGAWVSAHGRTVVGSLATEKERREASKLAGAVMATALQCAFVWRLLLLLCGYCCDDGGGVAVHVFLPLLLPLPVPRSLRLPYPAVPLLGLACVLTSVSPPPPFPHPYHLPLFYRRIVKPCSRSMCVSL